MAWLLCTQVVFELPELSREIAEDKSVFAFGRCSRCHRRTHDEQVHERVDIAGWKAAAIEGGTLASPGSAEEVNPGFQGLVVF